MEEKAKDNDDTFAEVRLRTSGIKSLIFSRDGLIVGLMLLFGVPNLLGQHFTQQKVDHTQETVEQVKQKAEETTIPTADRIEHELKNGLADRIAAKVNKNTDAQLTPIKKRLDAIERFLTGDESALDRPRNTNTASLSPAG